MLSQQEIMNNAFKDMLFHEEVLAKKYAELVQEIKDPQMQKMFHEMEVATHSRYNELAQKMTSFSIV